MKKMVTRLVALVLCLACVAPIALAAEVTDAMEENVINLEYQDYISNQDYYTELAKAGATLVIYVGEENEEAELQRISEVTAGAVVDTLQGTSFARETDIPRYPHDVAKYGRVEINGACTDTIGNLFTKYYYTGCTAYEAYIYNRSDKKLTADFVRHGETLKFSSKTIPAKSGVVTYITQPSWYGRFKNPCSVKGYVRQMVMN